MSAVVTRQSPIHEELEHLSPSWVQIAGMSAAAHFGNSAAEAQQAKILGLCDVTARSRIGAKGPNAATWLERNGITIPAAVYGHAAVGKDGLVIRAGTAEFFVEDDTNGELVNRLLDPKAAVPNGVYRFDRQDAALLLTGSNAFTVLGETCGYDFRHPDHDLIFTRVAGVSCMILRKDRGQMPAFHLWCDGSYGAYLWEQLLEISRAAGGAAVGIQALV